MIRKINDKDRLNLLNRFKVSWGSTDMVSRGRTFDLLELEGYVLGDTIEGVLLYHLENDICEILLLESYHSNQGIATQLLEYLFKEAKNLSWSIRLITTNDNTHALRFYQKRGFRITNLYLNAVNESRKLKPSIPQLGLDEIPIEHEIELMRIF